jgi:hypothetical protein
MERNTKKPKQKDLIEIGFSRRADVPITLQSFKNLAQISGGENVWMTIFSVGIRTDLISRSKLN